jgi:hypothetical protein
VLVAVLVAAVVYLVQQAFPTTESFEQAATCAGLRIVVNNAETAIDQADLGPAERADLRRAIEELRAEYDRQCAPAP